MKKLLLIGVLSLGVFLFFGCQPAAELEAYDHIESSIDSLDYSTVLDRAESLHVSIDLLDLGNHFAILRLSNQEYYLLDKSLGVITRETELGEGSFSYSYSEPLKKAVFFNFDTYVIYDNDSRQVFDDEVTPGYSLIEVALMDQETTSVSIVPTDAITALVEDVTIDTLLYDNDHEVVGSVNALYLDHGVFYHRNEYNDGSVFVQETRLYQWADNEIHLIRTTETGLGEGIFTYGDNMVFGMADYWSGERTYDVYQKQYNGVYALQTTFTDVNKIQGTDTGILEVYKDNNVFYYDTDMNLLDRFLYAWNTETELYPVNESYYLSFVKDSYKLRLFDNEGIEQAKTTLDEYCAYIWGDQIEVAGGILLDVGSIYLLFDGNDFIEFEDLIAVTDDAVYYKAGTKLYEFKEGIATAYTFSDLNDFVDSTNRYFYTIYNKDNIVAIQPGYSLNSDRFYYLSNGNMLLEGDLLAYSGSSYLIENADGDIIYLDF